jgi:thioredoxin 1
MTFTTENFTQEVLNSDKPVMVDFYADWCGPCKMLSPVVESLEPAYEDRVKIGKINVDDNPEIAEKYGVMSIPTLIFFKGGEAVDQTVGVIPQSEITRRLDSLQN